MLKQNIIFYAAALGFGLVGPSLNAVAAPHSYGPPSKVAADSALVVKASSIFKNNRDKARHDGAVKHNPNASILGQMLGGARSIDINGQGAAGYNSRHVAFCVRTYGSYNLRDNSFLAFSGERKQCRSPYMNLQN